MLPKLHENRCVMQSPALAALYVQRSCRKRAKRFTLTRDLAFSEVIAGCIQQHGESWLWPPMVALLEACRAPPKLPPPLCAVLVTSWELWEGKRLVAGELGVFVGRRYTSLTGFSRVSGSGMVQLVAMGRLLQRHGIELWDLGQAMDYKVELGCELMSREQFLVANACARGDGMAPAAALPTAVDDLYTLLSPHGR